MQFDKPIQHELFPVDRNRSPDVSYENFIEYLQDLRAKSDTYNVGCVSCFFLKKKKLDEPRWFTHYGKLHILNPIGS